jgi:glutathione synthase/RimK-type ligase-like ATP-grasp enzyme
VPIAKCVIAAAEKTGIKVFPNTATCWHFDDKVAQKYLLEAVRAPLVPSYVFCIRDTALRWVENATFPKVFKLRCGAASYGVQLVKSRRQARAICKKAFGAGFASSSGYLADYRTKLRKTKSLQELLAKIKRMPASLRTIAAGKKLLPVQKGYVLFQEFLEGNEYDTRVTVIGTRAFGFIRHNRPGDFRASGSGSIEYDVRRIDLRCVQIALETAERIGSQSLAFDFLFDQDGEPRIAEISYCYLAEAVYQCSGYWDRKLNWHDGHFWPENLIIEDLITSITGAQGSS